MSNPDDVEIHTEENHSDWRSQCGKEMRELMEKKFSWSHDDKKQSTGSMMLVMPQFSTVFYKLYKAVCDREKDADGFVSLLKSECTVNKVDLATLFNNVTPTGDSLLHVAAEFGREEVVELIASHYPNLLSKGNKKGDTPLHVASRAKNIEAINAILLVISKKAELIDKAEFLMLRNNYQRTALHEAVLSEHSDGVVLLLNAHRRSVLAAYWTWNKNYGCKSPMYLAVTTKNMVILACLLEKIAIPSDHQAISSGDSPLHAAILERNTGQYMYLYLLINYNMLDAFDQFDFLAPNMCLFLGEELLKYIVREGPKELMYQKDERQNTPFHYATYAGFLGGVHIMSKYSSPFFAFQQNLDGNLPIHPPAKRAMFKW
ncbi:protein ACCELERATED CELL DEATH 6-like [Prosopis cineraria]|uniref:protein ACCELERATED CELL DEATH 6-like n=1 Tax=Prosopis cineraria TaxID=364024 RepID=UPI00240EAF9B|nr:protein ACCELERATED CELL DEATH 6-like [Prosopis cineraria]